MKPFVATTLFCAALLFFGASILHSQTDTARHSPWHHELIAGLNLSEVDFSHWSQGGTNALSYLAGINGKSVRDDSTINWGTTYKLDFGQTKLGPGDIRKTDDEINIESMLTYKFGLHVNPYVAASLLTQFAPGYTYSTPDTAPPVQVSDFFDPAYFKQSAGMGWLVSKELQTRLGVALREIITNHFTQYAAQPLEGEFNKIRVQGGLESVTETAIPVDDNVLFRAKLDLFSPFKHLSRVVLHGETSLVAKISKVFSTQIAAFFINDPDLSPYTQIKQGLSIGITYAVL